MKIVIDDVQLTRGYSGSTVAIVVNGRVVFGDDLSLNLSMQSMNSDVLAKWKDLETALCELAEEYIRQEIDNENA